MSSLTDPYLTRRVEDALLGALLHEDNRRPDHRRFRGLTPVSFSTIRRQTLYAAILRPPRDPIPRSRAGTWLERVAAAAVAMAPEQYVAADTMPDLEALVALRDACPDPAHVNAYARLVEIGAFRRHIAAHTDRLTQAADTETFAPRAVRLRGLAAALDRQASLHPDLADHGLTATSPLVPSLAEVFAEPVEPLDANGNATAVPAGSGERWRAEREDQLLADLVRSPGHALSISAMLPADTFTDPQRRAVYEAVLALAAADDPIDEVLLAWHIAEQRTLTGQLIPAAGPEPGRAEADFDYLEHLAGVYPDDRRDYALSLASSLLAQDLDPRTHELLAWSCAAAWPPQLPPGPAPAATPQTFASVAVFDSALLRPTGVPAAEAGPRPHL